MPDGVVVTVLLHDVRYLPTLVDQVCDGVEVLTWDDGEWIAEAQAGLSRSWTIRSVASPMEALASATGEFLIEWNVHQASNDVLASLVSAARSAPEARGSLSANFDPAILWRRDEFGSATGRTGLAEARGVAIDAGASAGLLPPH